MKRIIILTFFIFLFSLSVFSSEKNYDLGKQNTTETANKDSKLFSSFKFSDNSLNSKINYYVASKYDSKIKKMTIMAGVGGGVLFLSQVLFYTGVGLYAYGHIKAENEGYSVWAADYSDADDGLNTQIMTFTGLGLMVAGVFTVLAALPILIVGLAVRMYYVNKSKKKVSFKIDYDMKNNTYFTAVAIKI